MNVTPTVLRSAYAHLRTLRPFSRWNLPPADKVKFALHIGHDHAQYTNLTIPYIEVNRDTHTTHQQILMSVAHEMCHLRQDLLGRLPFSKNPHNAQFRRMARTICHEFGWDVQVF